MEQTNIKNFDYEAFAKNLSFQAGEVFPQELSQEDKQYTTNIIYRFCKMAAEALVKEENSKLSDQDAQLITQFIGEWIFHKSIDLVRGTINDPKIKESILQKVAFTIFEIAKKAVENKLPQEQLIELVENHVKKCFAKAITDLQEKGALDEQTSQNALNQSNIDAMAQEQVEEEMEESVACMSDKKTIKLASLAILMRSFSSDKMKNILKKLNRAERDVLIKYLKMPDLEEKLDPNATIKYLEEMKNSLPEVVVVSYEKAHRKLCKIVKNSNKNEILNIIDIERPAVKEFVNSCYQGKPKKLPAYIADTISRYLEEKVS